MGLFDFFKSNTDVDWNAVKETSDVYPDNSISVVMTQTDSGIPASGWVDMAYVNYNYKRYCPFNLQFSVEIPNDAELDMGTVEDYFVNKLREGCVAHPVSRIATDFGFIMDIYVDDSDYAAQTLSELYEDPNKLVEFGCGFNEDKKWKEFSRIASQLK